MRRKLVTVIAEAVLESRIAEDLKRLGAHGYTATDVRGEGQRGRRDSSWEHNRNVRIETVCTEDVAAEILKHLADTYYAHYGVVTYTADVDVMRGDKF
jgi:nitrogen regulatory protein PII